MKHLKNAYNGPTKAANPADDKITVGGYSRARTAQRIALEAYKQEVLRVYGL